MAKMWEGRTAGQVDRIADDFNSSISVDYKMAQHDIKGSMAHASMLGAKNIITKAEADELIDGLDAIAKDLQSGKLKIDFSGFRHSQNVGKFLIFKYFFYFRGRTVRLFTTCRRSIFTTDTIIFVITSYR